VEAVEVPSHCVVATRLKTFLLAQLEKRFGAIEEVIPLAAATALDPRFKDVPFKSIIAKSKMKVFLAAEFKKQLEEDKSARLEATALQASSENETPAGPSDAQQVTEGTGLWDTFDAEVAEIRATSYADQDYTGVIPIELRQYFNRPPEGDRKANPFELWESMKSESPTLYKLSRRYLPAVGASSPAERLFHDVGLTSTDLRSRLTPTHLAQLTFLASVSDNVWDYHKHQM